MAISPAQLSLALTSPPHNLPAPSSTFLTSILSSHPQPTSLPALLNRAKSLLLASDIASRPSVLSASTPSLPQDVSSPQTRERLLQHDIPVQVLDIEDLSRSRWEQIEALEAQERGEGQRGRSIVRIDGADAEAEDGRGGGPRGVLGAASTSGTHRLTLQDVQGTTVYGLEVRRVPDVKVGMGIGTKLVVRKGAVVARGVVLLEPGGCVVLGGRIEGLHAKWVEGRKGRLLGSVEGA